MASKKPWDERRIQLQLQLRAMRETAGLKQVELAERLGADQSFVSRFERGERRLDLIELADICQACGQTAGEFVVAFEAALTAEKGKARKR
jgi:transcriptional regulator with XRE-family HTH domain